jgi:hypothetical protein
MACLRNLAIGVLRRHGHRNLAATLRHHSRNHTDHSPSSASGSDETDNTQLSYLAAATSEITLGTLVAGVTQRHPGHLAKVLTTLDVLSGGRAVLGIGAAWFAFEHAAMGVPFPPLRERFERLEETIHILRQMWSDDDGPFAGRRYRLDATINHPRVPVAPPLLIGGSGQRRTMLLVARHAQPAGELDRHYPGCGERGTGGRIVALGTRLRPDHRPLGCGEPRRAHGGGILREGEVEAEGHRIHAQHHVVSDLPRRETLVDPA